MPAATFETRYAELYDTFRRLARPLCHKRGFDPDAMTIEDAASEMLTYVWQHWQERPDDDAAKLAVWAFGHVWRRVAALAWDVDSLDETYPDSDEPLYEPAEPHHTGDDSHATAVDVAALVEWFNPMARRVLAMLATGRSGRFIQRALGLGERAARNTIAAIRSVVASVAAGVTVVIPKRLRRKNAPEPTPQEASQHDESRLPTRPQRLLIRSRPDAPGASGSHRRLRRSVGPLRPGGCAATADGRASDACPRHPSAGPVIRPTPRRPASSDPARGCQSEERTSAALHVVPAVRAG